MTLIQAIEKFEKAYAHVAENHLMPGADKRHRDLLEAHSDLVQALLDHDLEEGVDADDYLPGGETTSAVTHKGIVYVVGPRGDAEAVVHRLTSIRDVHDLIALKAAKDKAESDQLAEHRRSRVHPVPDDMFRAAWPGHGDC